ncbi:MAG TPA: DUF4397 domain-containing protein [Thermoanaerobaculaceae bacterium]|mgnify:CR=1 FL=1|nr:DUF4397 domain-containing protein [Thermoanaerobaculaceae bacterium]HRS16712.1 DUF4397 domain-containing protein [Thermoanaerobaculaceae bacterium]
MKSRIVTFALTASLGAAVLGHAATPLNAILSTDAPSANAGNARVRVVHASPDAPPVDVWVNGAPAFTNVAFEQITTFAAVPAGTYSVKVVPAGATSPVVIEADLDLAASTDYTVIATGRLASIAPVILTATPGAPQAGQAWVRFFHASPDAPAVDIAVTGGPVLFPNVAFRNGTDYLPVPAGTYNLEARVAGTANVALAIPGVTLADGGVYTAYATGLLADVAAMNNFYFVQVAARGQGFPGSLWKTDVDVQNRGARTATFKYLWLPRNTDNANPFASAEFTLAPGSALRHTDVLGAAFGVADGTDAFGALAVLSDSADLLLYTRTYNQPNGSSMGSFGQGFPGLAAGQLIQPNVRKRLLFFTQNSDFRSNIGLLNGTGSPITVKWERFTADGTMVGDGSIELPAWGNVQLNRPFAGEAPTAAAYIDVWTETAQGAFAAYATVINSLTSDPITILPQ